LTYPGLFIKIFRPEWISVTFEDENNELHEETFRDLQCRIFQHEMDHMDGIDFRSLAGRIALDVANRKLKKGLRRLKKMQEKT
jgi:peptide deformylase